MWLYAVLELKSTEYNDSTHTDESNERVTFDKKISSAISPAMYLLLHFARPRSRARADTAGSTSVTYVSPRAVDCSMSFCQPELWYAFLSCVESGYVSCSPHSHQIRASHSKMTSVCKKCRMRCERSRSWKAQAR